MSESGVTDWASRPFSVCLPSPAPLDSYIPAACHPGPLPPPQVLISDKTRAKALAPPSGEPPNRIRKQLLAEASGSAWVSAP